MANNTKIFLNGFKYTDCVRWYKNQLWFCDLWDNKIYCFNADGTKAKEISIDTPVGLGWLSDGSLLITSLINRKLLRYYNDNLSGYKNLEIATPGYCHDFTISNNDVVYLSASGFYPGYNTKPTKSNILMITPDKKIQIAAKDLRKAQVFKKYGLDFCCGGKKTVQQACKEKGLDVAKVEQELQLLDKSPTSRPLPYGDWSLDFLADYIVNTHHSYVVKYLREIVSYAKKVMKVHGAHHPELVRIRQLVEAVNAELMAHMIKEE